MKALNRLIVTALLSCVLALSVSAGEIHTGGFTPPPPPDEQQTTDGAPGEETGEAGDLTADVLAALLNGLLAVL